MKLYGNTPDTDPSRTCTLDSVTWASPENGDDGCALVFLGGFGHVELSHIETQRLASELTELLAGW